MKARRTVDSKMQERIGDAYKSQAEASKQEIEKQKNAAMREAYIGNMMDKKNVDQQLRANGMAGGLSESSRVAMQNNYRTNRNAINTAAIDATKDVDLTLQQNLAQNELARAGTKYNAQVTNAQFQNTAAGNKRTIDATKQQLEQNRKDADFTKYMTLLQNGYIDDTNVGQIASSLGVSEETVKKAKTEYQNGQYQSMALTLLQSGIYDDSMVDMFGGHFSADQLKALADQNKVIINADIASAYSKSSNSGEDDGGGINEIELVSNLKERISSEYYDNARTVGTRGNTGNGGATINGVRYNSLKEYADHMLAEWFDAGEIDDAVYLFLLDEFGVE